ncbi:MAG: FHA domain-containing protein [Pirellulaceae bacterium]|nr:FHA domain-containing protein [Pirellulaceae bacterium]
MEIRLKVIGGKNDGREIPVQVAEFVVGRGETAHLRPASDLVSRKHCSIVTQQGKAVLIDHESRNGTFLNGDQIKGQVDLKPGDRLRVGRLVFELVIDIGQPSVKRPKVDGVADAAQRATEATEQFDDDSISGWLSTVDQSAHAVEQTKQFSLDDAKLQLSAETINSGLDSTMVADKDELLKQAKEANDREAEAKAKKKIVGKLPDKARQTTDNSKDAATDVLQRFFNRR